MSPDTRLLVFTDLDATLLDESYGFGAAKPALDALRECGHPLVLASSKTVAEMRELAARLALSTPMIAENGGVLAMPNGNAGWHVQIRGLDRRIIARHAHAWRCRVGDYFRGFMDWDVDEISAQTGLDLKSAALAGERQATEPIIWQGSAECRRDFVLAMRQQGIRLVQGGRFAHLMGEVDKADGLRAVCDFYHRGSPITKWIKVALGDSQNDAQMLAAADIAVVIPNPRASCPLRVEAPRVMYATAPGPKGWNTAMNILLDEIRGDHHG